jgi:hypothetical protein
MLGSAAAAQAADPGWQPVLDLSSAALYNNPTVAADEAGGFIHTWSEPTLEGSDRRVHVDLIPHSGAAVSTQNLGGSTSVLPGVGLAASGQGEAIVAWDDYSIPGVAVLRASFKDPGEAFAAPVTVPSGVGDVSDVRVAMNPLGESVILYTLSDASDTELWAVFRSADGVLASPVLVSGSTSSGFSYPEVEISANGEAVAAWTTGDRLARAAIGTSAGFSAPVTLSDPSKDVGSLAKVALDASGGALVAWVYIDYNTATTSDVMVAVRTPGGAFGAPTFLPGPASDYYSWVDAAVSAAGDALVVYREDNFSTRVVHVNTSTGVVGSVQSLAGAEFARVAVAPDGRAVVVRDGDAANWGSAAGSLGPGHRMACEDGLADVAIGPGGDAGAILFDYGPQTGSSADDRTPIARSDPSLAPNDAPCRTPGPPATPPVGADRPRIFLKVQRRVRPNAKRWFKVTAVANTAGRIDVSGNALVGPHKSKLRGSKARLDAAGSVQLKLRLTKKAYKDLARDPTISRANVAAHLDSPIREVTRHFRVQLVADGRR